MINADDQHASYNGVTYTYAADGSLADAGSTTWTAKATWSRRSCTGTRSNVPDLMLKL